MIKSNDYADTEYPTQYDNTGITVTTYSNYEYDYKYEPEHIAREIESVRSGWHIPKKITMKTQQTKHNIKLNIRNQLRYKMRAVDNCL